MDVPQYCSRCGSQLSNGVCMTCPVRMVDPAAPSSAASSTTPIAPPPQPPAMSQPPGQWGSQQQGQWGQQQGQWGPQQGQWGPQQGQGQWGQQGQWGPQQGQGQWNASAAWSAPRPTGAGRQFIGQWNWGAFLLCPFWLMNHGRIGRGILYMVLSIIPFLGLISVIMGIVYGVKGNEVAVTSRYFRDDAQFVDVQNAWRNWGIGVTVVAVVLFVFVGIVGSMGSATHGR